MRKAENNYAFIDSHNVNLAIRSTGWVLDWHRSRVYLREKYGVGRAFLFIGYNLRGIKRAAVPHQARHRRHVVLQPRLHARVDLQDIEG